MHSGGIVTLILWSCWVVPLLEISWLQRWYYYYYYTKELTTGEEIVVGSYVVHLLRFHCWF
jgi:hypothetical protein